MHSLESPSTPEIAVDDAGVTALLLFDYECVGLPGDDSLFNVIRTCLEKSEGICALNDAGVISAKTLNELTRRTTQTKAFDGGLLDGRQYARTRSSAAAMWTDHPENVQLFHSYLNLHAVPRYMGTVLLDEEASFDDFVRFCGRSSPSASLRRGFLPHISTSVTRGREVLAKYWRSSLAKVQQALVSSPVMCWAAGVGIFSLLGMVFLFFFLRGGEPDIALVGPRMVEPQRPAAKIAQAPAKRADAGILFGKNTSQEREASPNSRTSSATAAPVERAPEMAAKRPAKSDQQTVPQRATRSVPSRATQRLPFSVQIGAFRNPAHAKLLTQRLNARGYPASVSVIKLASGETMHRVRVGAFATRKEARLFGQELKREKAFVGNFFVTADQ